MSYIECKNLTLGYDGMKIAGGIEFVVNKGDYLCIVGENGAGKSTLVKAVLNLLKPMGGEIIYGDGLRASDIGYLPQQTVVQKDFPATVKEVALSGTLSSLGHRPFYGKTEKKKAEEKLKEMGMWELRNRCYRDLSGGQQQRTLLARALCATEKIILMDEPVSGLDPVVTNELYEIIKNLNKKGTTVIMVSHDPQAFEYATHVLHVSGQKSFFGTKEEYLENDISRHFIVSGGQ